MIPSDEALRQHWMRSCWILHMWGQADSNNMVLKPITNCGCDNKIKIVWDTKQNMEAIRNQVLVLTSGCKCKTGCTSEWCSCRKKQQQCTEGCQCLNCTNITDTDTNDKWELAAEEPNEDIDVDELMDWVFGNDTDSESEDT